MLTIVMPIAIVCVTIGTICIIFCCIKYFDKDGVCPVTYTYGGRRYDRTQRSGILSRQVRRSMLRPPSNNRSVTLFNTEQLNRPSSNDSNSNNTTAVPPPPYSSTEIPPSYTPTDVPPSYYELDN